MLFDVLGSFRAFYSRNLGKGHFLDPLTHAFLGGTLAQATGRRDLIRPLALAGVLGAVMPDLDFLIHSSSDPMKMLEYHRHFTHALFLIPAGGLIAALLFWLFSGRRYPFQFIFLAALLGYATHGLLDASTSWGTMLYWPFSQRRISWDLIAIIDPLFTLVLGLGFFAAYVYRRKGYATLALFLAATYLYLGWVQRDDSSMVQRQIAEKRGHSWERGRVLPTLGNIILWRSIYESEGRYYIDAIRKTPWGFQQYWEGGSLPKFSTEDFKNSHPNTVAAKDVDIFSWFTDGYLVPLTYLPEVVADLRYGMGANSLAPLWGISLPKDPQSHVALIRWPIQFSKNWNLLWKMILGREPKSFLYDATFQSLK